METPSFSLVVCTVDRTDRLERLFTSLATQSESSFEVILVDQNDDDRLQPLIQAFSGRFAINHTRSARGLSRARNVGIAAASGIFVGFPDDDCWYSPSTLQKAAELFRAAPDLAIITGRTLDQDGVPSVSPTGDESLNITRDNYLHCGNSNGIFVRNSALRTIGGFDEYLGVGAETPFQSGEEADFLLRALQQRLKLHYFPSLIVHHDQVITHHDDAQIRRAHRYGLGFGALLRKQQFPISYVAYRLARPFVSWIVAVSKRDRQVRRYKWAWLTGIAMGYATWPKWASQRK